MIRYADKSVELFNLKNDLSETNNLAGNIKPDGYFRRALWLDTVRVNDVLHLAINIVDENGIPVVLADNHVTCLK